MTERTKNTFSDKTYSLAKSLHCINNAKLYLEDVRLNSINEAKGIFNSYIQKCEWILGDVKRRLNKESREILIKDLEDSLLFDAIADKLIRLDKNSRDLVENYIDELIKEIKDNESSKTS
jgi:hypothetical protein